MKRVFILHLAANAALIILLYVWLGIRDARAFQIVVTVVLGASLLAAFVWLHAATWHWMRVHDWRVPRNVLLKFTGAFLVFLATLWLLSLIPVERAALWTASLLTFRSRKPIAPDSVRHVFAALLWLVKWFVLPVVLLGQAKRPRFWLVFAGLLFTGWYIPQRLVYWAPHFKSTAAEVASFLLRWSMAYVIATAAWLFTLRKAQT